MKQLLAVLLVLSLSDFSDQALPASIKPCAKNAQIGECFKDAFEQLRPNLKTGEIAPDISIEPLQPLFIDDIDVKSHYDLKLTDIKVNGAADYKVAKADVNIEELKFEFLLLIPKITMSAPYSLKWDLGSLLNIDGKGQAHVSWENVNITMKLLGSRSERDGETYVKIDSAQLEIKPATVNLRFENLFNGDKNLEDFANDFINTGVSMITGDFMPQIEQGIAKSAVKAANKIFELAPEREFFP